MREKYIESKIRKPAQKENTYYNFYTSKLLKIYN